MSFLIIFLDLKSSKAKGMEVKMDPKRVLKNGPKIITFWGHFEVIFEANPSKAKAMEGG